MSSNNKVTQSNTRPSASKSAGLIWSELKKVTWPTRKEAINRMLMALDECVLEGIKTIIPYHKKILNDKNFISGNFDTGFLNKFEYKEER